MDPIEINGGRFYARPLHDDNRIDDRPALSLIMDDDAAVDYVAHARQQWAQESALTWAVCEQTSVEMLALARLVPNWEEKTCTVSVTPCGDTSRVLPNDPVLAPKTVGDAASEIMGTIRRWAEGFLELKPA